MTIKRYKPVPRMEYKVFSCPPIHCAGMDETAKGDYVRVGDLRERLENILVFCPDDPYDIVRLRVEEMLEDLQ